MKSLNGKRLLAYGLRMLAVITMTGFVAWLPGSRATTTAPGPTVTIQVSWGGNASN